jgi:molybdopterin-containing oxidoreductase family iron-sulfur binding subunit
MDLNRRDALKSALIGGAALAGGGALIGHSFESQQAQDPASVGKQAPPAVDGRPTSDPVVRQGIPGRKWVMVIDLATCDGCGACTRGCSKMHFVPADREWIPVMKMQDAPETAPYFFPKPCFHCDSPPCTKVCPVDATFKRQDGIVLIDNERCIGCRFCMAACPYSTRHFNWGAPEEPAESKSGCYSPEHGHPRRIGTVEKCDFCPDMAERGLLPACVQSCPMGVVYYGDQNEDAVTNGLGVTVRLSKLLEERAAYRFMEELGTEPRVYYLPPKNRKFPGPKLAGKDAHAGAPDTSGAAGKGNDREKGK